MAAFQIGAVLTSAVQHGRAGSCPYSPGHISRTALVGCRPGKADQVRRGTLAWSATNVSAEVGLLARADQMSAAIGDALSRIRSDEAAATDRQIDYLTGVADALDVVRGEAEFIPPNPPRLEPADG